MSQTLPLQSGLTDFKVQAELDGTTYGFQFTWSFRSESWTFSIFDSDGNALARGLALVVDWPLATRVKDSRMPPGTLMAQDSTGKHQDPGIDDLGNRTLLLYFSPSELVPA